ncbi:tetratricopeptide repeat protein [Microvirga sp. W0021]|uniref:Tetratricopeptide repeat protein n=1 Tax=Hohaiivirga grylli TaxID=3133970 RepID=A0ABV0BJM3_9HYPH
MVMKRLVIATTLLALGCLPALAQPKPAVSHALKPDLAYGAYQRGFFLTAKKEAEERLKKQPKDAAAMTLLGEIYSQGLGVPANPKIAADWYDKAAQLNDPHAMSILGLMMYEGIGVPRDAARGKILLEKSAGKGNALAAYNLGLIMISSDSPVEIAHAAMLFQKAAEADIPDAQHALGFLYLQGRGLEKNSEEAAKWFLRAADNGSIAGEVEYAILAYKGEGMPANAELAAKYFKRAAYKGNAIAQNRLARLYAVGRGVPQDKVEAASWHMLAASKGLADAWLDADLRDLSRDDQARAERIMRERAASES